MYDYGNKGSGYKRDGPEQGEFGLSLQADSRNQRTRNEYRYSEVVEEVAVNFTFSL